MLTIKNLTKAHAGRTLFTEAELVINWGERMALVGPNGAGKSTLFRMIMGEDSPDEGEIQRDEYATIGYLPQEAGDPSDRSVLEIAMSINPEMRSAIRTMAECEAREDHASEAYAHAVDTYTANDGYRLEAKAKRILKGLAFRDEDFHRPAREMSGGWVMRAHMAQLLAVSGVTKEEASKAANISLPTLNQRLREPGFWRIDELVGIAKKCGTQAMAFFKEYREM